VVGMHSEHVWMGGQTVYDAGALDQVDPAVRGLLENRIIPARFFFYFRSDGTVGTFEGGSGQALVRFGYTRDNEYVCLAAGDLTIL
jgi:hypothetical protein